MFAIFEGWKQTRALKKQLKEIENMKIPDKKRNRMKQILIAQIKNQ